MAYSSDEVFYAGSWTAADAYTDDIVEDADATSCLTDGVSAQDCDEIKRQLHLRAGINLGNNPAALETFKVRMYQNTWRTAGDWTMVPYVDSNSVNSAYKTPNVPNDVEESKWIEFIVPPSAGTSFWDNLEVTGDNQVYVRLVATDTGKTKIGELEVDFSFYSIATSGTTYDNSGSVLGGMTVNAYAVSGTPPPLNFQSATPFATAVSNASTGVYSLGLYPGDWVMIVLDPDTPDRMDITERITVVAP